MDRTPQPAIAPCPRVATALALALALFLGCGPEIPRYEPMQGRSGTAWRILEQEPLKTRGGRQGFRIQYETLLFEDGDRLQEEVERLLEDRRRALEKRGFEVAIIVACTPIKSGWAATRDTRRFRFRRSEPGAWERLQDVVIADVPMGGVTIAVH